MYTFRDGKKMQISGENRIQENFVRAEQLNMNEAVAMRNRVANRMLTSGATGPLGPGGEQQRRPWYKHWYIILIIVLLVAAIVGGLIYMSHHSRMNRSTARKPAFGYYF
jgi:hypothetical protein